MLLLIQTDNRFLPCLQKQFFDRLPWMGDGRREATPEDIRSALDLYSRADGLLIAVVFVLAALIALT